MVATLHIGSGTLQLHYFAGAFLSLVRIRTSLFTSASLPPSRTTRLKLTFEVRLVVVNVLEDLTTKLNVVSALGARAGFSFVPPITHWTAWPTTFPLSS